MRTMVILFTLAAALAAHPDPKGREIPQVIGGRAIRCSAGVHYTAERVQKLVFTDRFPMPPDDPDVEIIGTAPPDTWEVWAQQKGCGDKAFAIIKEASAKAGLDPALTAAIALPESSFDPGNVSPGGHYGLLQISRYWHAGTMKDMGLDFNSEADRCYYGCKKIADALRAGKSMWQALQPWEVRPTAIRTYRDLRPDGNGLTPKE